jgi:hypothetical protein
MRGSWDNLITKHWENKMATTQKNGCSGILLNLFGIKPATSEIKIKIKEQLPYQLKDNFLSPAESSFYHVLKKMTGDHLEIFPQVPLASILFVTNKEDYYTYYNKIDRKRIDYLICEPKTLRPVFVIELDDSSHRQANRAERDNFVESVLAQTNLPLVRVPVRQAYNTEELGILFKNALQRKEAKDSAQEKIRREAQTTNKPPFCPKCGIPMVLRIARRGNQSGEKFWGCQNYPDCRQVIKIS